MDLPFEFAASLGRPALLVLIIQRFELLNHLRIIVFGEQTCRNTLQAIFWFEQCLLL